MLSGRARRRAVVLAALGVVAIGWLGMLQTDITAGNTSLTDPSGLVDPLMDDSGEFVVAWQTWGVTHPPGYPLLNAVGNVLVRLYRGFGASPAGAASLVSFGFALLALALAAALVGRCDRRGAAAAGAVLLPAFGELMWLYASVAEVYALGLLLAMTLLALAIQVGRRPARRRWVLLLGLVLGLAVGHHRTLLALVPAVAVGLWPVRGRADRVGGRVWLAALGLALLSIGVYAYLPLAAIAGSPWVYGRSPATWAGLIDALLAREYMAQLGPSPGGSDITGILGAVAERVRFLAKEMTRAGLALGLAGVALGLASRRTRRVTVVMAVAAGGYLLAPVGQHLLIGTHLMIMVASVALAVAWGLGLAAWTVRRPGWAWAGLGLTAAIAAQAWWMHRADIATFTQDPDGRHLIDAVAALPDPAPVVVEAWSPRYFALAYGKWATGDLGRMRLIDARADLAGIETGTDQADGAGIEGGADQVDPAGRVDGVLYTTPSMLFKAPLDRWSERLGAALALESAGDGLIAVRRTPRVEGSAIPGASPPAPEPSVTSAKPGAAAPTPPVTLSGARAWWAADGDIRLALEWRALRRPGVDYHVFVQATDRPEIRGPEDILAQGDRDHPVYGFYPTSRWRAGERVRDDFRLAWPGGAPADRRPTRLAVGLYTVGVDGTFTNALTASVPIEGGG